MKTIELTKGQVAIVDDEDHERLSQYNWHASWSEATQSYYARRCVGRKKAYMHREIAGAGPGEQVDHRNHLTLDNRRENLRRCTKHQNVRNARKLAGGTSKYKGVHWNKQSQRWKAAIYVRGKTRCLGFFRDEEAAARAYADAARAEFGEYACTEAVA